MASRKQKRQKTPGLLEERLSLPPQRFQKKKRENYKAKQNAELGSMRQNAQEEGASASVCTNMP